MYKRRNKTSIRQYIKLYLILYDKNTKVVIFEPMFTGRWKKFKGTLLAYTLKDYRLLYLELKIVIYIYIFIYHSSSDSQRPNTNPQKKHYIMLCKRSLPSLYI